MKLDGFQTFFTSFIIGTLNLVGLTALVFFIHSEQQGVNPLDVLEKILHRLSSLGVILGTIATVFAVFAGQVVDALGHLIVDGPLKRRAQKKDFVKPELQAILGNLLTKVQAVEGMQSIFAYRSIFYSKAPEHVFAFREEEWKFYEIYRNLAITMVLHLAVSLPLWAYRPGLVATLDLFLILLLCLFVAGIQRTLTSMRDLECSFAIGWLYEQLAAKEGKDEAPGEVRDSALKPMTDAAA